MSIKQDLRIEEIKKLIGTKKLKGTKIIFNYYENMPTWKLDVFEIVDMDLTSECFLIKTKDKDGIDIYAQHLPRINEFITLKKYRKLKIQRLNEISRK